MIWNKEIPTETGIYPIYDNGTFFLILLEESVHSDRFSAMCISEDNFLKMIVYPTTNSLWGPKILSLEDFYALGKFRLKLKRFVNDVGEYEIPTKNRAVIRFTKNIVLPLGPKDELKETRIFNEGDTALVELIGDSDIVDLLFSDDTYALDVTRTSFEIVRKYGSWSKSVSSV